MATSTQSVKFTGLTATTTANFTLKGGRYGIVTTGAGAGSANVQIVAADGTNVVVNTGLAAGGSKYEAVDLPPGLYNFTTAGLTAVSVSITNVPT